MVKIIETFYYKKSLYDLLIIDVLLLSWPIEGRTCLFFFSKVKRPGEENVKCTIMFLLDYQVKKQRHAIKLVVCDCGLILLWRGRCSCEE